MKNINYWKDYFEVGTSWFKPLIIGCTKKNLEKENIEKYIQFRKDVQKVKASTVKLNLMEYTFNDFISSGMVRSVLTENKMCYTLPYTGILSVLKQPTTLFSFDK